MKLKKNQVLIYLSLFALISFNLLIFQNCAPIKSNVALQSSTAGLVATSIKADGQCGSSINNCMNGSFINVADTSTQSLWKCNGSGGGQSILCSSSFSNDLVDGICTANINGCAQGLMVDSADSLTENFWRCEGINGGQNSECRALRSSTQKPANGQCGSVTNTCTVGSVVDSLDSSNQYLWICRGTLGAPDSSCAANILKGSGVGGLCGTTLNSCLSGGTFTDIIDTRDASLWRCTNPNGATYETCPLPKSKCTVTVQDKTHINENFTYNFNSSLGLPSQIKIKTFGSRTNPDGTGLTQDADGSDNFTSLVSTPIVVTSKNSGGTQAGVYDRYFILIDPSNGTELCTTNVVRNTLTPACGLSASVTSANTNEFITLSVAIPAAGELPVMTPVANITWFGTKTTLSGNVTDENGSNFLALSAFPFKFGPFIGQTDKVGNYTRYFIARDSKNIEVCKSNTVSFSITEPPAPTPTPTPTPSPSPTPTPPPKANCLLQGQTVLHGATITAYSSDRTNYGNNCSAILQARTCDDGVLNGSPNFSFATCTPDAAVNLTSCHDVFGLSASEVRCPVNEVAQSFSVFAGKFLSNQPKLTCCQINVDIDNTEQVRSSGLAVNRDNVEHVANCLPNELMSGLSVTISGDAWDGNLSAYCKALPSGLSNNSFAIGAIGKNGLTPNTLDNNFHTANCFANTAMSGISLWATSRLDNIDRLWCGTPAPATVVTPPPGPGPIPGGCFGNFDNCNIQ